MKNLIKNSFQKLFLGTIIILGLCLFSFIFSYVFSWNVNKINIPQYISWKKNSETKALFKQVIEPTLKEFIQNSKKESHAFLSSDLGEWQQKLQQQFWIKSIHTSRELPATWEMNITLFKPQYHLLYEQLHSYNNDVRDTNIENIESIEENKESKEINQITEFIGDDNELKQVIINNKKELQYFQLFLNQQETLNIPHIEISDFELKPNSLLLQKLLEITKIFKQFKMPIKKITYNKIGFVTAMIEIFQQNNQHNQNYQTKQLTVFLGFLSENKLLQQLDKLKNRLVNIQQQLAQIPLDKIPEKIKIIEN